MGPFDYTVTQQSDGTWTATTPYRHVMWVGATEQEAIGAMLSGLCDLTKRGYFDPDDPHAPGAISNPEA